MGNGIVECPNRIQDSSVKNCQGDLFLCPGCEAHRFVGAKTVAVQRDSGKGEKEQGPTGPNHHSVKSLSSTVFLKSSESVASYDSDDCCISCLLQLASAEETLKCDICKDQYHQSCSGLSTDQYASLSKIIDSSCRKGCRGHISKLKTSLAALAEEVADLRSCFSSLLNSRNQPISTGQSDTADKSDIQPRLIDFLKFSWKCIVLCRMQQSASSMWLFRGYLKEKELGVITTIMMITITTTMKTARHFLVFVRKI